MQTVDWFTFNRRISSRLSAVLIKTPLTPNHVTTLSMGAGLWAGYFLSTGTRGSLLLGAFFLQISYILDNCDGDIARAKNLKSRFGMWYDFTADLVVDFALWSGLALGAVALGVPGAAVRGWWLLAMVGSVINYCRVTGERLAAIRASISPAAKIPPPQTGIWWKKVLYVLGQDGDATIFIYLMALIGSPWFFLLAGSIYVNALWILSWNPQKRSQKT